MDGNSCDWDDDSYTAQKLSKFGISLAWYIFSFIVKTAVNNNVYLINVCRLKKDQTSHSIAVYSLIKLCNMLLRYYRKRHEMFIINAHMCFGELVFMTRITVCVLELVFVSFNS